MQPRRTSVCSFGSRSTTADVRRSLRRRDGWRRKASTRATSTRTRSPRASTRPRCPSPTSSSGRPASCGSRTSSYGSSPTPSSSSSTPSGPTSESASSGRRSPSTRTAAGASAVDECRVPPGRSRRGNQVSPAGPLLRCSEGTPRFPHTPSTSSRAAGRPLSPLLSRFAVIAAGLPLVLFAAYYGGWALLALLLPATLLALHELYRMSRALRPLVLAGYGGALAAVLGASLGGAEWMLGGFTLTLLLAFVFAAISETRQSTTVAVAMTVLGAAWIGLGLGFLILVRDLEPDGRLLLITVLLTVFVADTFAYLGGRLAGRHRMAPDISPGKTWEGFVSGVVGGVLTTWLALNGEPIGVDGWEAFALGGAIVLAAVSGDLFESMVKRDLGVKDSGRVLMGHGGVLDRVDSMVFAGPAAYFTVLALTQV